MKFNVDDFLIKTIDRNDAREFFQLIKKNTDRLEDYFAGTVAKTKSLEATEEFCLKTEELIQNETYIPFLLIHQKSKKAVGLIDFKNIDWNVPKAEVGAFIDVDSEGKGLISKVGSLLIDTLAKQYQFKKIYCRAAPENKRSINSILRYGFELEGTLRRDYKTTNGRLIDLNYYGKLFE